MGVLREIRMIGKIMLAAALALSLGGCAAKEQKKPVSIQFVHGWGSSGSNHEFFRGLYNGFADSRPDLSISMVAPASINIIIGHLSDMLAVYQMPDIVLTGGRAFLVRQSAKMGEALDLMPYIDADPEFKASIDQSVFDTWLTPGGSLHTIPDSLEVQGYWYNEDIWRKAGVRQEPSTWEEFWEMCAKVRESSERENSGVAVFALEEEQIYNGFLLARLSADEAGRAIAEDMPETFDTPQMRGALLDVKRLWDYSRQAKNIEDAREDFRNGKTAVFFNGLWDVMEISTGSSSQNIRYANYPTSGGEALSYISPQSGYLLRDSGDADKERACVDFLKHILAVPQQNRIMIEAGHVPCNPNADLDAMRESQPLMHDALMKARSADVRIINIEIRWEGYICEFLRSNVVNFGLGRMSLDQMIDGLNDALL
jgi:ABC-type glycerol-3-phosphate transport system substrate-binding protein